MKNSILLSLAFTALCLFMGDSLAGSQFHVTTTGQKAGSGTLSSPWDLQSGLSQPSAVHPGDTLWIHGGIYAGTYSTNLNGTSLQPVVVRNWNNERVTIDGGNSSGAPVFSIGGSYTWYWGLEIMSSATNKVSTQATSWPTDIMYGEGVMIKQGGSDGTGCKFINLVIHDTRQGVSSWKEAVNSEVYGCVVYDNGWLGSDRLHGHNFYIQNVSGTKVFADNFILRAYSHNIQSYGSSASNEDNETFEGNFIINGGERNFLLGGDNLAHNPVFRNNVAYLDGARAGSNNFYLGYAIGYSPGTDGALVTGNYIAGGNLTFNLNANMTFSGNTIFHTGMNGDVPSMAGNTVTTTKPQTNSIIIRPNKYEPARANIVVLNWTGLNAVDVDISSIVRQGDPYVIRDAQNYYGTPVASGTYAGGTISIPMTGTTVPDRVGNDPRSDATLAHTAKECGTFVLFGSGAGVILPNVGGSLNATPTTLSAGGGNVTLSWTSHNATGATIDHGIGSVPTSGSRSVSVTATTTFTLTLDGQGGPVVSQATVQVAQAPLSGPVLATPLNGASGLNTSVLLFWNAVSGATGYEVQLARDSLFSTLVYSNPSVAGTSDGVSGLNSGTTYYWRVRGKNGAGNGSFSGVWRFSTALPPVQGPASLPLALMGTPPEEGTVDVTVVKPAGATQANLVLSVYDADGATEGSVYVNGTVAAPLFGAQASPANDLKSVLVTFTTGADFWTNGMNHVRFVHSQTAGFRIDNISVSFTAADPGVNPPAESPIGFSLAQNFPNPFNPTTTIRYAVRVPSKVTLLVFNALGQTVATLVDAVKAPGAYAVQFNGSTHPSGVYYYQLLTDNGFAQVQKMILVR